MKGVIYVEGHGEVESAGNLISRLWLSLELPHLPWGRPRRSQKLHLREEILRVANIARQDSQTGALLILKDEDDACPKDTGPELASHLATAELPFPEAYVLLYREYETLFLSVADSLAGRPIIGPGGSERPGLDAATVAPEDPESIRGAKEWLTRQMPSGRAYKPTLDQLPLTRMVDLKLLQDAGLPSVGTLTRALGFLGGNIGKPRGVYPRPGRPSVR